MMLLILAALVVVSPGVAQAQVRPSSHGVSANTDLQTMLAHVPATLPDLEDPAQATIGYADIAAQLEAFDVPPPISIEDEGYSLWLSAVSALALPSDVQWLEDQRNHYGFDLFQVDQTLSISQLPFTLTLYRGQIDQDGVESALKDLGYAERELLGKTVFGIRGDYEFGDLDAPTIYTSATMNYAAFLDDGTLAVAPAQTIIEAVLEVQAGERDSMAEQSDIAAILPHVPQDLATALFIDGSMLTGGLPGGFPEFDPNLDGLATPDLDALATEQAEQREMPPVTMALLGTTVGGPLQLRGETVKMAPDTPDAREVALVHVGSADEAESAATIIGERLATGSSARTGEPFATSFPERTVEAVPETPVVLIELTLGEDVPRGILMWMFHGQDLGFLAW